MAKQRLKSPRVRLFTALDLPTDVRAGLERWQARECADQALRPVAPDALHVTLCFLGYHPERAIGGIAELLAAVDPRPVPMRFEPNPVGISGRRPGLYAISSPSDAAVELQRELGSMLAADRLYKAEKRPFWPHVTVARVRPERRPKGDPSRRQRGRPRVVERLPGPLPSELLGPFGSVRVALYLSHLRPSGAEYERLAVLELPPATSGRER
ncbi:MAG: RNA 2',3'-cyclic phosphodiesterase [bacterium]